MKIAFVYDVAYPWHVGGIENVMFEEAKALAKKNEVHFFSLRWPKMQKDFRYEGINYHTFHDVNREKLYRHGRRSVRESVAFSLGLHRLFGEKYDVVVTNFFPILHVPIVYVYCKLNGSKLIMEVAEIWSKEYWIDYIGGFMGRLANAYANFVLHGGQFYIVNSSATESEMLKKGIPKRKIVRFAPTVDDAGLSKIHVSGRKPRMIFSGRLIKEKRIDKWLEIFSAVKRRRKDAEALVVGDGPEKGNIANMIKNNGLSDSVELRPFFEGKKEFYKAVAESSVFLNVSEREGLSIVSIESVMLGTPVVLPRNSPVPEEVKAMCVVADENGIPDRILEIMNSKSKEKYIRNSGNAAQFEVSKIPEVYSKIFKLLE